MAEQVLKHRVLQRLIGQAILLLQQVHTQHLDTPIDHGHQARPRHPRAPSRQENFSRRKN